MHSNRALDCFLVAMISREAAVFFRLVLTRKCGHPEAPNSHGSSCGCEWLCLQTKCNWVATLHSMILNSDRVINSPLASSNPGIQLVMLFIACSSTELHRRKLIWQWKMNHLKMYLLLNMLISIVMWIFRGTINFHIFSLQPVSCNQGYIRTRSRKVESFFKISSHSSILSVRLVKDHLSWSGWKKLWPKVWDKRKERTHFLLVYENILRNLEFALSCV